MVDINSNGFYLTLDKTQTENTDVPIIWQTVINFM